MRKQLTYGRVGILLLLACYALFLLDLALLQFPTANPRPNFIPLHSILADFGEGGRELLVNSLGNLVAFMPIGLIPALVQPRATAAWHVALFCLSLSALIEVIQYASGCRVADIDDLILNTIGGLLGFAALQWARPRVKPNMNS